jgi:hypothetical protein
MATRKSFLLRLPDDLLDELNRWARDELRSVNAQIEYLLRREVIEHRRRQLRSAIDEQMAEEDRPPPADPM